MSAVIEQLDDKQLAEKDLQPEMTQNPELTSGGGEQIQSLAWARSL